MNAITSAVVVGVDGTAANQGALRYAVEEARRSGSRVRLVHVVPDRVPVSPMMPILPDGLTETGEAVLRRAEEVVRDLAPHVDLETWLRHGSRVTELLGALDAADLLVLGRDDRPVFYRLVEGDTTTRLAARAHVPVVEVPANWRAAEGHGFVLVGVQSAAHSGELLGHALAEAHARSARLVVLHAWRLPSAYDDIIEARIAQERVVAEGTTEMQRLLKPWRIAYPEVPVEIRIVHDRPAHALLEASADAELLVIVRRMHGIPAAAHLGGTARAVLRNAECPVAVVSPAQTLELSSLVVESGGELLK